MKAGFNFLKPQVEAPNQWTIIYGWVVNTSRVILIVIEVTVIMALVIRVFVDIEARRLDQTIEVQESVLNNRSSEEQKYRDIQAKTLTFQQGWDATYEFNSYLDQIYAKIPTTMTSISIAYARDKFTMSGEGTFAAVDKLEKDLKAIPFFANAILDKVELGSGDKTIINNVKFSFNASIIDMKKRVLIPAAELQPGSIAP
jgi:hypothetical protein